MREDERDVVGETPGVKSEATAFGRLAEVELKPSATGPGSAMTGILTLGEISHAATPVGSMRAIIMQAKNDQAAPATSAIDVVCIRGISGTAGTLQVLRQRVRAR
jgi:hypothetical protein